MLEMSYLLKSILLKFFLISDTGGGGGAWNCTALEDNLKEMSLLKINI